MIQIDMRMPQDCFDCPCSYYIQSGTYQGQLMCNVREYQGKPVKDCLMMPQHMTRWEECPMEEIKPDERGEEQQ